MNKLFLGSSILLITLFSFNVSAFTVGLFDYEAIFKNSKEGQEIHKTLEKEVKKGEEKLKGKYDEIVKLRETYEKQKAILSEEGQVRKQQEIIEKTEEFQHEQSEIEQQIARKELELKEPFSDKVNKSIISIAEKMELDLTVSFQENPFSTIKKKIDITTLIITELEKDSKKK